MKHLKLFGLAALAAMAIVGAGGSGTASATVLCTSPVSPCPPEAKITTTSDNVIVADITAGTSMELRQTPATIFATCTTSTMELEVAQAGSASETFVASVAAPDTWSGCGSTTGAGSFEIHHIAGTSNGTLTVSGFELTMGSGATGCTYTTGTASDIGVLTGSTNPNSMAVIHIETVLTRSAGFICRNDILWLAQYSVTQPQPLYVAAS